MSRRSSATSNSFTSRKKITRERQSSASLSIDISSTSSPLGRCRTNAGSLSGRSGQGRLSAKRLGALLRQRLLPAAEPQRVQQPQRRDRDCDQRQLGGG